ncbi:MAG: CoA-binding protein [Arcobacteraceae bacterium]|nr:CoA-binding protein [Arcobacteraceae bacterium]
MECEFPTINSNKAEMKEIFDNTKSIAVIGCSPDKTKDSNKVAKYLIDNGFIVYPIYPKEDFILGQKVYRSLAEVPCSVDMVNIFRKPAVITAVVDACISKGGVKYVWSQLGLVNNVAMEKAEKSGMKAIQNYCTKVEHNAIYN